MSQAAHPDAEGPTNYDVDVDLLLRKARTVDVAGEREAETEFWSRSKSSASDAIVEKSLDRDDIATRL